MAKTKNVPENYKNVRAEIVELLKAARSAAARNINSIMTAVYWEIGRRIVHFDQAGKKRAEYADVLITRLAKDLTASFGRGFGARNLAQMRSFYLAWPEGKILQTLSAESQALVLSNGTPGQPSAIQNLAKQFPLPWSAYVRLLSVKNPDARAFYEHEARRSGWSVRQLDRQIGSQFYERIALSKNKAARSPALDETRRKPAGRTHSVCRKGSSRGPLRTRQSSQQSPRRRVPDCPAPRHCRSSHFG